MKEQVGSGIKAPRPFGERGWGEGRNTATPAFPETAPLTPALSPLRGAREKALA